MAEYDVLDNNGLDGRYVWMEWMLQPSIFVGKASASLINMTPALKKGNQVQVRVMLDVAAQTFASIVWRDHNW